VVPPAGSRTGALRSSRVPLSGPSSWRAIGRRPHGSRVTFTPSCPRGSHRPALAPGPSRRYSSRSTSWSRECSTGIEAVRPIGSRSPGANSAGFRVLIGHPTDD